MKKTYINPLMEIFDVRSINVLAVSSLDAKDYLGDDLDWGI